MIKTSKQVGGRIVGRIIDLFIMCWFIWALYGDLDDEDFNDATKSKQE